MAYGQRLKMNYKYYISRRNFLKITTFGALASFSCYNVIGCSKQRAPGLIKKIESAIIWPGRTKGQTWFHPRACRIPSKPNPVILMTCQTITGSDVFSQVHWSRTSDNGQTWTLPQPITSLGRQLQSNGIEEGFCDVVPDYHKNTNTLLAIGHNVYYQNDVLTQPYENRYPVYVTGDENGNWSERKKLFWNNPETTGIYTRTGDFLQALMYVIIRRE